MLIASITLVVALVGGLLANRLAGGARRASRRGIAATCVAGVIAVSLDTAASASPARAWWMDAERQSAVRYEPTGSGPALRQSTSSHARGVPESDATSHTQRNRPRRDPLVFLIGLMWFLVIGNCLVLLSRRHKGPQGNVRPKHDDRLRNSDDRHDGPAP